MRKSSPPRAKDFDPEKFVVAFDQYENLLREFSSMRRSKCDFQYALIKMLEAYDIGQESGPNGAIAIARKAIKENL